MRVLVTGSEGYIGSVLTPALAAEGHTVVGLDTGLFADGGLVPRTHDAPVIWKDVRDVQPADVAGFDAVIHLAALSNDPLGQLEPGLTLQINHVATVRLAEMCRRAGVERFLFSSSCSLYGKASDAPLDESARLAPQTPYARSKVLTETDLGRLARPSFSPVYLRNATAYGISPRQRFDLVVPNLCGWAQTTGEVKLSSDGGAWRPLVHIGDICGAFMATLTAPTERIHNQAFNIGVDAENFTVREIAEAVAAEYRGSRIRFGSAQPVADNRSYRVSFAKARAALDSWRPCWTLQNGIRECRETFARIGLTFEDFHDRRYTRLKQLQHLRAAGLVDETLRPVRPLYQEQSHERNAFTASVS